MLQMKKLRVRHWQPRLKPTGLGGFQQKGGQNHRRCQFAAWRPPDAKASLKPVRSPYEILRVLLADRPGFRAPGGSERVAGKIPDFLAMSASVDRSCLAMLAVDAVANPIAAMGRGAGGTNEQGRALPAVLPQG